MNQIIETMNLKEKVVYIVSTLEIEKGQTEFGYYENLTYHVFANNLDLLIIKEKMDNIIKLLYRINALREDEFEKLMDLDFEDEAWLLI